MKEEFIPCRKCANDPGPKPGFIFMEEFVKECDCHKAYRENRLFSIRAKNSNVWPNPPDIRTSYLGTKSLESRDQFIKYIENFKEYREQAVYITGPNGTQKTSVAMWGAYELIKQGWKVQYILMYRLIELLTASFEKREEYEVYVDTLKQADLLIIDESFTKDKVLLYKSGYQLPFLDSFLRSRVDVSQKGTLFISNKPSRMIESEGFGKSIQDLVERNTSRTNLEFHDNYMAHNVNNFESGSLFK